MPAYSYKERFVPMVLDGSKPFTIRNPRRYATKVGDTLYHYYAMRTRSCRKLIEDKCIDVAIICISDKGSVSILFKGRPIIKLSKSQKDRLAWLDGFRVDGSTLESPCGCFAVMCRWWRQTNDLPFAGDIIMRSSTIYGHGSIKKILLSK